MYMYSPPPPENKSYMPDNADLINYSTSLFTFLLIISGNFIGSLLPCRVQQLFSTNVVARHLLGFFTLTFFVVLASKQNLPFNSLIAGSIFMYVYFLMLSRTRPYAWLTVVLIAAIVYMMELMKHDMDNNSIQRSELIKSLPDKETMSKIQIGLITVSMIITIIGFVIYLGEKKVEYGRRFDLKDFVFGKPECRLKSRSIPLGKALKALIK